MASRKSVLITGCSKGGIGDVLAQQLHQKGLLVFATARSLAKIEHLKEQGIKVLQLDVVDDASIQKAVEQVGAETGGKLDFLINNSGGGYSMPLLDSDLTAAKQLFDVNVFALVGVTKAFSRLLIASKGTVVNVGSGIGYVPYPWSGWYNTSKAAANLLTDVMRIELGLLGVKVVLVVCGGTKTNFFNNLVSAPQLPATSPYIAAKEEVQESMSGENFTKIAMDAQVAVKTIVDNILSSSPTKRHWVASGSFMVWFVSTFGWATIWDTLIKGQAKLGIVQEKINAAAKSK
ncbi:hypothetical protein PV10_03142 [Exophiala mesophila]|uniref:NADPH-dependent 1-acyldihydroxyacetone phosphate reductase n=1 Tax=Exophiala mesophila TaxID=212818 RepID=A0A0D1X135_EXOME|nr:uncharacterized protein PV10_03142 [Exophiala mesophila]KIV95490.1 hypothetical protein PV10_03142 [Exophiala mesophila]